MLEVLESGTIIVPVGSRVTCSPPPIDTDEDFLLLVENMNDAVSKLVDIGFSAHMTDEQIEEYKSLSGVSCGRFKSLRFGDVNYIITESCFFFDRFLTATHICKTMNVLDKQQRILIFHAVFGDSYLNKTPGITDDLVEIIYDNIEVKTFEEDVVATPFEEHVAMHFGNVKNKRKIIKSVAAGRTPYHFDPITQVMTLPSGLIITREDFDDIANDTNPQD